MATIMRTAKLLTASLWLLACVAVLVVTLRTETARPGDAGMFFGLAMMALTFPLGVFASTFVTLFVLMMLGYSSLPDHWSVTAAYWVVFVAVGYWQWFELVPQLVTRRRPAITALKLGSRQQD